MIDDEISALQAAWFVSLMASSLLFAALSIASIWDSSIYLKALGQAVLMDHF
ncbi:MAG TPA: hypothetical protein VG270_14885 [Pseudolabrys sp.]|jgi:hypothetical protein|nr:hypothetical protein [Pseudolabrys sp.]